MALNNLSKLSNVVILHPFKSNSLRPGNISGKNRGIISSSITHSPVRLDWLRQGTQIHSVVGSEGRVEVDSLLRELMLVLLLLPLLLVGIHRSVSQMTRVCSPGVVEKISRRRYFNAGHP